MALLDRLPGLTTRTVSIGAYLTGDDAGTVYRGSISAKPLIDIPFVTHLASGDAVRLSGYTQPLTTAGTGAMTVICTNTPGLDISAAAGGAGFAWEFTLDLVHPTDAAQNVRVVRTVRIDSGTGTMDLELAPATKKITVTGAAQGVSIAQVQAIVAAVGASVAPGSVTRAKLAPDVIAALDTAATGGLADGGVTSAKMADLSVPRRAIIAGAVDKPQLSSAVQVVIDGAVALDANGQIPAVLLPAGTGGVTPEQGIQLAAAAKGIATGTLALAVGVDDVAPASLYASQNPAAEYDPVSKRTFLAYLGGRRALYVTYFDHVSAQWGQPTYVGPSYIADPNDTHGAPSLAIDQDKRRVCVVYGAHGDNTPIAQSGADCDVSTWTVNVQPAKSTYGMMCYEPTSKALYLTARSGGGHGATFPAHEFGVMLRSTDGGGTWTDLGAFINTKVAYPGDAASDYYGTDIDAVPGRVYIAWAIAHGAQHDGPRAGAHVAYYDTAASVWRTAAGVSLGAVIDTAAKITSCRIADGDFKYPIKTALGPGGKLLTVFHRFSASGDNVQVVAAYFDGSTWQLRDTGIRSNNLYYGLSSAWRDGRWEVGCVRVLDGDRTVTQTSAADIVAGASGGGDFLVLASTDGLSWAVDSTFGKLRFVGGGCQYVQDVRGASPDLTMLTQAISLGGTRSSATGPTDPNDLGYNTSTWNSTIYTVHARTTLPRLVGLEARNPQTHRVNPYYRIVDGATPTDTWQTMDLTGIAPSGTTEVTLKVVVTGTGTAGGAGLSFREGTTNRSSDAQISSRGEWADAMVFDVVVPLSPNRTLQWKGGGPVRVDMYPRAFVVGSPARSTTGPPPPADTVAPTTPGTPVATSGPRSASATTSGSTDAVGVTEYRWYRGATRVTGGGKTISETGLVAGTPVTYTVEAVDAAGNVSVRSAASNSVAPTPGAKTTVFTENFNRADANAFGAGWAPMTNVTNDYSRIIGNQGASAWSGAVSTLYMKPPTVPTTSAQWTQMTVAVAGSATGIDPHLTLRNTLAGATVQGYILRYNAGGGAWQLYRQDATANTLVKSFTTTKPADGYVVYAEMNAAGVFSMSVNGAVVADMAYTDTTPLTGTGVSLNFRLTAATEASQRVGEFTCGDLA